MKKRYNLIGDPEHDKNYDKGIRHLVKEHVSEEERLKTSEQ